MPRTEDEDALERTLRRRLYRKDCPPPEVLGEMRLGLLSPARSDALEHHLRDCPHCRAELQSLDRLLQTEDRERSGLRRLLGRLIPPSMVAERPAFALRGGGRLTDATYEAGDFTVMLAIHEDPQDPHARSILGMLTSGYETSLDGTAFLAGEAGHLEAEIDEDGQFAFSGVVPGRYVLDLEVGSVRVELEPLEIR
ncbi:MAG: hypothetical protein QN163_06325 [Armatimonadota bacterium]|nr:hypothetical protein [Armatimonadota bacterium]MDR5697811.1 hypothetical protein [Armatimonadota bacterium]